MASMMDSLGQHLTPDNVGRIAGMLGVDQQVAQQGMSMAAPLLLGAAGRKAATPEGAAGLTQILGAVDGESLLGSLQKGDMKGAMGGLGALGGLLGGGAGAAKDPGTALVNQLLGSGGPAITSFVKQRFGFDIGPFLPMAAPILAGMLSNAMKSGNLDAGGVAKLLQSESQSFAASNPSLAADLNAALDQGEQLDSTITSKKARFSDADWTLLLKGPLAAGAAVMLASPSGLIGGTKEAAALLRTTVDAAKDAAPDSLLALLKSELQARHDELDQSIKADMNSGSSDMVAAAIGICKRAVETVRATGDTADATAYSTLLLNVASAVAGAAKEGGFLGIGGTVVNEKEQAALNGLRTALA